MSATPLDLNHALFAGLLSNYVTDDQGRTLAVQIDLRKHSPRREDE